MNPIERFFNALVQLAVGLMQAIVGGLFGAPGQAVRRIAGTVQVRRGAPHEVIDLRHAVLRSGRPRATATFDGDDHVSTRHWVAKDGDDVIGVVSVMAAPFPDGPGPTWQLRGMAVDPTWRGKGIGAALLAAVEADVGEPLWCNARTTASGFYLRHGWVARGETFEIEGVGPHVRLVWESGHTHARIEPA